MSTETFVAQESDSDQSKKPSPITRSQWPLELTKATWNLYQAHCLPGGLRAFGMRYHARAPVFDSEKKWLRESMFLHRPEREDRGKLTPLAVQRHLTGNHIAAVVWPGMMDRFEIDIDRKYADTVSWDSVVERLVSIARALGFISPVAAASTTDTIANYGDFEPFQDAWDHHAATLPGVFWQSSSGGRMKQPEDDHDESGDTGQRCPGGIRWTVFLDGFYPADEVREVVLGLLEGGGIGARSGHQEVWPNGDSALRLPLGRGSVIIDPLSSEPVNAQLVYVSGSTCGYCDTRACSDECREKNKDNPRKRTADPTWEVDDEGELSMAFGRDTWHRKLGADIELWTKRATNTISFSELQARLAAQKTRDCKLVSSSGAASTQAPLPQSITQSTRRQLSPIANLPPPVVNPGERNDRVRDLVCGWYVGGMTREDTLLRLEHWLRQPGHAGSLSASKPQLREKVIAGTIASTKKNLDLMDKKIASGQLKRQQRVFDREDTRNRAAVPHLGSLFVAPTTTTTYKFTVPCFLKAGERRRWRDVALEYLTAEDRQRICAVEDKYLTRPKARPKLGVLVGLLRMIAELEPGHFTRVKIPWSVAEAVAGTRFPADHPAAKDIFGRPRRPYNYLLEAAQAAGFLGKVITQGQRNVTVTVYEVPLSLTGRGHSPTSAASVDVGPEVLDANADGSADTD